MDWRAPFTRIASRLRRPRNQAETPSPELPVAPRRLPTAAQWRLLPTVFPPREWQLVRLLIALTIVATAVALTGFLSAHLRLVAKSGGRYSEVIIGSPQYVNPLLAPGNDADEALVRLLYGGLLGRAADGSLQPVLASAVDRSADGTVYTAHLRANLRWPDDEPFNSDDVISTFETVQDARLRLPLPNRLRGVKVEAVDETTVRFTLPTANPNFPAQLTLGILPAHLWANVDPSKFALVEYNLKPIGLGPFQLKELRRDRSGQVTSYTLARSKAWPGKKPFLSQLTLRFVATANEADHALTDRSAEAFATVDPGELPNLRRGIERRMPLSQYVAVFWNEKTDPLKDAAVRRALASGTDRTVLTQLSAVRGRPVDSPILPGPDMHPQGSSPAFDRAAAEKMLEEAGWKRPAGGGTRAKGDTKLAFTLTTVDDTTYGANADSLKAQWDNIGAEVTVERIDPTRFQKDTLTTRRYTALLFAEQVGHDGDPYPFWHSSQERSPGLNLSTFYRKDMDAALERYRSAANESDRDAAIADFQRIFSEELPALILYQPQLLYVAPRRLGGLTDIHVSSLADRFNGVADWYVQRRLAWK